MEGKEDAQKSAISREESKFIEENIDSEKTRALFVEGMLLRVRMGEQTLEEILEETTKDHEGPDQSPLWKEAYNFIKENKEFFGIDQ